MLICMMILQRVYWGDKQKNRILYTLGLVEESSGR